MPSATTSNNLFEKQMSSIFFGTNFTTYANLYIALFVSAPDLAYDPASGPPNGEVASGIGYSRVAVPADNTQWQYNSGTLTISNINEIVFGVPTGDWGLITHVGIFDSGDPTLGNLLYSAQLTTAKQVSNGDGAPKIVAGQLRITRAYC